MPIQLTIDREFRDACPYPSDEELRLLRESIVSDGCREPIIYWENAPDKDNPVIDGHTRHNICTKEKKTFQTKGMKFKERDAVLEWIWRNQLGRRNLTDAQRHIIRGQIYNAMKGKQGGDRKSKGQSDPLIDAAQAVADEFGGSPKTSKRDGKLAEAVEQLAAPVREAVEQGDIPMKEVAALAELTKSEQKKAAKAIQSGEAKNVAEAIEEKEDESIILDGHGKAVPPKHREAFTRGLKAFKDALSICTQLKKAINSISGDELVGPAFSAKGISNQAKHDIDNVRNALRFSAPFAICPYCKSAGCKACGNVGWVGERVANSAPPETKE